METENDVYICLRKNNSEKLFRMTKYVILNRYTNKGKELIYIFIPNKV